MTSAALPARFMEPNSNTKVDRKLTKHWFEMSWLLWLGISCVAAQCGLDSFGRG